MEIVHTKWGKGEIISITHSQTNFSIVLTNFGAAIVRILTPDRNGNVSNIVFGQNSPELYEKIGGYMGATVGRVANRIANGSFKLNGVEFQLPKNDKGINCLHGGIKGLSYRYWDVIEVSTKNDPKKARVTFEYISPEGEEGFPGEITIRVSYTITPMQISWEYVAFTDKSTIVNLTNHSYWNLESLESTIDNHVLTLSADKYSICDQNFLPTGEIKTVERTGVDFRNGKLLKDALHEFGDIDHNFFIKHDSDAQLTKVPVDFAEIYCPVSGRKIKMQTTEPCAQIYTGNFMDKLSSFDKPCIKHNALCIETQKVPNAINVPQFAKSVIIEPGKPYYQKTILKFSVIP
ncbi:MAG: aldose epimerase family protein [Promethearchaeota archaeon]